MSAIIGKIVAQFHMNSREVKVASGKNYRCNPSDTEFPFGKEVTLMVIRNYIGWTTSRTGGCYWEQKSGGAGYPGIILGPKFNSDGSVNERVIGIGTGNEVLDFKIDPNASPDEDGHATLIGSDEHPNDFAEYTGWK